MTLKKENLYALLHIKKGEQLYACYYNSFASNLPETLLRLLTEFAVSNVWRGPVYVVALPRLIVVLEAPAVPSHLRIRF